jgi:hypothetical protein
MNMMARRTIFFISIMLLLGKYTNALEGMFLTPDPDKPKPKGHLSQSTLRTQS